jgi:hypothetical protein
MLEGTKGKGVERRGTNSDNSNSHCRSGTTQLARRGAGVLGCFFCLGLVALQAGDGAGGVEQGVDAQSGLGEVEEELNGS